MEPIVTLGDKPSQTELFAIAARTVIDDKRYKGKWVEIRGENVVNSAKTVKGLFLMTVEKGTLIRWIPA